MKEELKKVFTDIMEYQMDHFEIARATHQYKLAEKGLKLLDEGEVNKSSSDGDSSFPEYVKYLQERLSNWHIAFNDFERWKDQGDQLNVLAHFVLLWDTDRKEYCRVESGWSTKDLDEITKFRVIKRFHTEQEVVEALKKAKQGKEQHTK